jgi:hypothetical protein
LSTTNPTGLTRAHTRASALRGRRPANLETYVAFYFPSSFHFRLYLSPNYFFNFKFLS